MQYTGIRRITIADAVGVVGDTRIKPHSDTTRAVPIIRNAKVLAMYRRIVAILKTNKPQFIAGAVQFRDEI